MNKVFSDIVIPILGKGPHEIIISEKYDLKLIYIGDLSNGDISLYQAKIFDSTEILTSENFKELSGVAIGKRNILKLFCFLENPYFDNQFFIQGINNEELKELGRAISISYYNGKDYVNSSLKDREARAMHFGGITKIDSTEIKQFRYLIDEFSMIESHFEFILEIISAVFDSNEIKVKFLLLSSLLEFFVISDNQNIAQNFTQRLSILKERYIFEKKQDGDAEYKRLLFSGNDAYEEIKMIYNIRSDIIHGNVVKLKADVSKNPLRDLKFYYKKLVFLAKFSIEMFITDKDFINLLNGTEKYK